MDQPRSNEPARAGADQELSSDSDEDFAGKYEDRNPISRALLRGYFSSVRSLLAEAIDMAPKTSHVHEVGCAEGYSTQQLSSMLPASSDFTASELLERQVAAAKRSNPHTHIVQADVCAMPHNDASFDGVFILEVLEHVSEPKDALAELRRLVRPHGWIIAGAPREPLWRVLNCARGKYWSAAGNTPGHIQHWSSSEFVEQIESDFGPVRSLRRPLPWTIVLAGRAD
jgi:ubiquinone/menaquinone biosynthesis C-methylase UbiE